MFWYRLLLYVHQSQKVTGTCSSLTMFITLRVPLLGPSSKVGRSSSFSFEGGFGFFLQPAQPLFNGRISLSVAGFVQATARETIKKLMKLKWLTSQLL
jgi:hypothetical protein